MKIAKISNIVIFILWFALCLYRGVICGAFNIYDYFAPKNHIDCDPILILLLIIPLISPIISIFLSVFILINSKKSHADIYILAISLLVMIFRVFVKPNVIVWFWI